MTDYSYKTRQRSQVQKKSRSQPLISLHDNRHVTPMVQHTHDAAGLDAILQGKFEHPKQVAQLSSVVQMNGWERADTVAKFADYLLDALMATIILIEAFRAAEAESLLGFSVVLLLILSVLSMLNSLVILVGELKKAETGKQRAMIVAKMILNLGIVITLVIALSTGSGSAAVIGGLIAALIAVKKALLQGPEAWTNMRGALRNINRLEADERSALFGGAEMEVLASRE